MEGLHLSYRREYQNQWMDHFMKESRHPVFELELLPIAIALCVLGEISKKLPKRVLSGQ